MISLLYLATAATCGTAAYFHWQKHQKKEVDAKLMKNVSIAAAVLLVVSMIASS